MALADLLRGRLSPSGDPPIPAGTPAGVMVPVIEAPDPQVLFTVRTHTVRDHKGEVSFPGGAREPDDEHLLATALRETEEELGIPPSAFDVLGALEPIHTMVSGYVIVPFVGVLAIPPELTPNPDEIAEVLRVEVSRLVAAEREEPAPGGSFPTMYVYGAGGHLIWGATGRILHGFLRRLRGG